MYLRMRRLVIEDQSVAFVYGFYAPSRWGVVMVGSVIFGFLAFLNVFGYRDWCPAGGM